MFGRAALIIFIVSMICCSSDDYQTDYIYLTVASSPAPCYEMAERLCVQAQDSVGNAYIFPDGIGGFYPRWGSTYEIIAEVTYLENPPYDEPSEKYHLVETLSVAEDQFGSRYAFLDVLLIADTFTMDNGNYYFFGRPFTCARKVDCDALIALNNTGGFVDIRFSYRGDAQIELFDWHGL